MSIEQSNAKRELAGRIKRQLQNCVGFDGDELDAARKEAYNYYFQRPRGDEIPGRSNIVTGDLSSMVEGSLAQMVEPLVDKRIAEFCAYDEKDEEQAQLESECVSEMLFKRQNGFIEVSSAIKDALLIRNAVVKVYVDTRKYTKTIRRNNVDPEVVLNVLEKAGLKETDVHTYDRANKKLSATVTKTTKEFCVESLSPENFLLPKNWHRQDLKDIGFCAERHVESRSTLVERGFSKELVYKLRRYSNQHQSSADARLPRSFSPNYQPLDKSQELVEWYECYCKLEGADGAAELHRVCISDKIILEDEQADLISYAMGIVIINPHTFIGISLHDKLKSTQDSTTALTRALMDNLNASNKNRTAHLDGIVEESDLTDGRVNGSTRVTPGVVNDVRQAIMAMPIVDTSANILQNLEHCRRTRSEMGGATLDMATGQMQLNDRVGSLGLDRAYSVMEQLARYMIRVMAHTLVRSMYLIAHETLRTQWREPIHFKPGKEWITVDPSKWRARTTVKVNLGASPGERMRVANVLEKTMDKQIALASAGMEDILVDANAFYTAMIEWLRINDIDVPERFILNPNSDAAKQAFANKAKQRAEQAKKQDALMYEALALEKVRVALDKYGKDMDTQFKYWSEVIRAQIEEARLTVPAVVDVIKARHTAIAAMENKNGDDSRGTQARGESVTDESPTAGNPQ